MKLQRFPTYLPGFYRNVRRKSQGKPQNTKSKKNINFTSCGYKGKLKKNGEEYYKSRKFRTEAEHIFPVSKAKGAFPECRIKGTNKTLSRSKCLKVSAGFRALEGDLFNLEPALGSLNAIRSNLSYAEISGEKREWGKCDFEKSGRKIEPPQNKKGDIARIYFYLNDRWPSVGIISKKNRKLFEAWNKLDPVDEEEIALSCLKAKYQGNVNPYVSDCKSK